MVAADSQSMMRELASGLTEEELAAAYDRLRPIHTPQVERLRQSVRALAASVEGLVRVADHYNGMVAGIVGAEDEDDCERMVGMRELSGPQQRRCNIELQARPIRMMVEHGVQALEIMVAQAAADVEEIRERNRRGWKE